MPCSPRSTSRVLGQCSRRHRHQEFVRFLDKIDRDTPAHLEVHLIADNYATHKHAAVRRWLERHPRFHIHFTPTSWLNMVERLFADLTCRRLRRGCFRSVAELKSAIRRYLNDRNAAPKPFVWTKGADGRGQKPRQSFICNRYRCSGRVADWLGSLGYSSFLKDS